MTIQLYGFWRSNAAFRVKVALALKKLPFEEIEVDILAGRQFDADYAHVNAERVVPTLVHDGHHVFQSMAIMEYLDEVFPEPRLMPEIARERAYVRAVAQVHVADSHPFVVPRVRKHLAQTYGVGTDAIEAWCAHWGRAGLATYERMLMVRPAAPFVVGATPTLADICVAGQKIIADLYQVDMDEFPRVAELTKRCFEMPEFAEAHPFRQPGYRAVEI
ncbi:maleylacetoacetate isomerase [Pandoraea sputorum]|uniref:Stringent starvation protein A homolog n=1 Tax=Pandoraea sputorum TaxID=93222 RepID=A0A239SKS9_9BURK|nr:maleylacetoacetate isomerase [Pandoraea sputorum]BET09841.1 maleylacetoacetate isomerase [Pandoraea sputorum]SNU85384.1 Stringent starvation protein A homolog [Pandoraea sputorum]VVD85438.1 maleylacetoacetate isomerase [Pandoraea sputorum]